MAGTNDQTISLNLGQSLDQSNEKFVQDQNTLSVRENFIVDKERRLAKRYGTEKLPTDVITTFPDPLTIGPSAIPTGGAAHRDQLLMQNKGELYSYSADKQAWRFVGHQVPVEARSKMVVSSAESRITPSVADFGNYRIIAYVVQLGNSEIRYSVIDKSTGAYIVDDRTIAGPNSLLFYPNVIVFEQSVCIIWQAGNTIQAIGIDTTSWAPSWGPNILKTDADISVSSLSNSGEGCLDFVYTNKAGVGERAIIIYKSTTCAGALFAIDDGGVIDPNLSDTTWNATFLRGFGIFYNDSNEVLYIARQSSLSEVQVRALNFTSSGFTNLMSTTVAPPNVTGIFNTIAVPCHCFVFEKNPDDIFEVVLFMDNVYATAVTRGSTTVPYYLTVISRAIFNSSGTVSGLQDIWRGSYISGKPILDTVRRTIYLPTTYASDTYSSHLIIDWKRGVDDTNYRAGVMAQVNSGTALGIESALVPKALIDGGLMEVPCEVRGGFSVTAPPQSIGVVPNSSIGMIEMNMNVDRPSSSEFLNNGTYFSGGFLSYYDGARIAEHNFFAPPEFVQASCPATTSQVGVNVVQQGSASQPEIVDLTFYGYQSLIPNTDPNNGYIVFNTPSTTYSISFRKGSNFPPSGAPGTPIFVQVDPGDSPDLIAKKTAAQINAVASSNCTATVIGPGRIRITNLANGSVTDPNTSAFTAATFGPGAGTYQYCVVWRWMDVNGQIVRSAPSIPVTITKADQGGGFPGAVYLYIHCPPITNRYLKNCEIEVYRTTAGGNTFYYVNDLQGRIRWSDATGSNIEFVDTYTDQYIQNSEVLYTTGGVLSNWQVPACTSVSAFKNRLVVGGVNDSDVFYSKAPYSKEVVNFAEELFIQTENNGEKITGHYQLDDKLVITKEKSLIYYAGDGANDLGASSTFSQPVVIASDVGCTHQNTIDVTPLGLFFSSKMGIQLIDRSASVQYIGEAVKDFNVFPVTKTLVLRDDEKVREVRFLLKTTPADAPPFRALIYNYLNGKWGTFTAYEGTDACLWQGQFVRFMQGDAFVEKKGTWKDVGSLFESYEQVIETAWLKLKNVQDFQRVKRMMILGALKSPHTLNFQVFYDYDETSFDVYSFDSSNISGFERNATVYQPEIHLSRQKCDAIKIRMTVTPSPVGGGTEECLNLVDMSFLAGFKAGLNKVSARKKL